MNANNADGVFTTAVAVQLCTALVDFIASQNSIRSLTIKGPLATELGMRPARFSSDVDVLVEPGRSVQLVSALSDLGWKERFNFPGHPVIVDKHSTSLFHPQWPCDIDVHHAWPGFFIEPESSFNRLWETSQTVSLAHKNIRVPDNLHHSLIMALHALREPNTSRGKSQYSHVVRYLSEHFPDEISRKEIVNEINYFKSGPPLLPLVLDLGLENVNNEALADMRLWNIRGNQQRSLTWIFAFNESSLKEKPKILWAALFPSATALRYKYPEFIDRPLGLLRAWLKRFGLGVLSLRNAWKIVRNNGASENHRDA